MKLNKRGLSFAVLIQLLVLLLVIGTIYAASTRVGNKEVFLSEAYAANSAMIAEAMFARSDGKISITTAYGGQRETSLDDGRVAVGSADNSLEDGLIKHFYQPDDSRSARSRTQGRLQTWLRSGDVLTLNPAQITGDNCPRVSEEANWESIFAMASSAPSVIDGVYAGIGVSPLPETRDNSAGAELKIYIEQSTPLQVVGPEAGKTGRLACLLSSELLLQFNQQADYVPSDTDEIRISLSQELSPGELKSLFEAATGRVS